MHLPFVYLFVCSCLFLSSLESKKDFQTTVVSLQEINFCQCGVLHRRKSMYLAPLRYCMRALL